MASKRRVGSDKHESYTKILDATQALMVGNGYGSVSARRVAEQADVKPALLQYYFPTMDSLFLALYRREAERSIERQAEALSANQPLHALWRLSTQSTQSVLAIEFMALANHRKVIATEIAAFSERSRALQATAIAALLKKHGFDTNIMLPAGVSLLLAGAARALMMEHGLGITDGHAEAKQIVENWLSSVEP